MYETLALEREVHLLWLTLNLVPRNKMPRSLRLSGRFVAPELS